MLSLSALFKPDLELDMIINTNTPQQNFGKKCELTKVATGIADSLTTLGDDASSLALRMKNSDFKVANMLAEIIFPHIERIASSLRRKIAQTRVQNDDLVEAGCMGFMSAVQNYKPGERDFLNYAQFRIRGAMLEEIRVHAQEANLTSRGQYKMISKIKDVTQSVQGEATDFSDEMLADKLGVSTISIRHARENVKRVQSLDASLAPDSKFSGDLIEDPATNPFEVVVASELKLRMDEAFAEVLTPQEADILNLNFGRVDGEEVQIDAIAPKYSVTPNRISVTKRRALRILREETRLNQFS